MLCKDCFMRVADCNACATPRIYIPENATNGDILKAVFPNLDASVSGDGDVIDVYSLGRYCQTFDTDWWNAPYKVDKKN